MLRDPCVRYGISLFSVEMKGLQQAMMTQKASLPRPSESWPVPPPCVLSVRKGGLRAFFMRFIMKKKLAVILFIAIAAFQATGGFAVSEKLAQKSSASVAALETRLAAAQAE